MLKIIRLLTISGILAVATPVANELVKETTGVSAIIATAEACSHKSARRGPCDLSTTAPGVHRYKGTNKVPSTLTVTVCLQNIHWKAIGQTWWGMALGKPGSWIKLPAVYKQCKTRSVKPGQRIGTMLQCKQYWNVWVWTPKIYESRTYYMQ